VCRAGIPIEYDTRRSGGKGTCPNLSMPLDCAAISDDNARPMPYSIPDIRHRDLDHRVAQDYRTWETSDRKAQA
jgi:hypothetical protein